MSACSQVGTLLSTRSETTASKEAVSNGSGSPRRASTVSDWETFEWDPVTRQDYDNIARVQWGRRSSASEVLYCNPRQEGNVAHMHRVIDRYLFGA